MTARTMYRGKRGMWRSGHCSPSHPPEMHARCAGSTDATPGRQTLTCVCACHKTPPAEPEQPRSEHTAPESSGDGVGVVAARPAVPVEVTSPGVYDLDDATYHADPVPERLGRSLSSTGARILATKTPAHFAWRRDHPEPPRRAYDWGHAVHRYVLTKGLDVAVVDAPDWRSKAAREERDAAYDAGAVPLLLAEYSAAQAAAEAVLAHPVARVLFERPGTHEQSLFWPDPEQGVWRRARPDARCVLASGRTLLADLKTSTTADPDMFGRKVDDFGYHVQAAWYLDGAQALGLAGDDAAFIFVVIEKDPPHLVSVIELDDTAMRIGRDLGRRALAVYAECQSSGVWPGYSTAVEPVSLPRWSVIRHEERTSL